MFVRFLIHSNARGKKLQTSMATSPGTWRAWLFGDSTINNNSCPTDRDADASARSAWLWSWLSLMLVPWPRERTRNSEQAWDPSRGVGDWKARLAALQASDNGEDEDHEGSKDGDDDNDGGGGTSTINGASGDDVAVVSEANKTPLDERPDSQLTDAELLARHPWLNE